MAIRTDIQRIRALLRPERSQYAIGLLSLLFVNACDVIAPLFLAVAIDITEASLTGGEPATPALLAAIGIRASTLSVVAAALLYMSLALAANLFRYPMLMFTAVPSHRIGQPVRNRLTGHMLRLSRPYYDRAKSGDLMSLATNDVNAVRMMLGPGILVGPDTIFIVSLVLVVLFSLSWQLTLIALIPLPIIGLITNWLSHAEYDRFA